MKNYIYSQPTFCCSHLGWYQSRPLWALLIGLVVVTTCQAQFSDRCIECDEEPTVGSITSDMSLCSDNPVNPDVCYVTISYDYYEGCDGVEGCFFDIRQLQYDPACTTDYEINQIVEYALTCFLLSQSECRPEKEGECIDDIRVFMGSCQRQRIGLDGNAYFESCTFLCCTATYRVCHSFISPPVIALIEKSDPGIFCGENDPAIPPAPSIDPPCSAICESFPTAWPSN